MTAGITNYPKRQIEIVSFPTNFAKQFSSLFPQPAGLIHNSWPPDQVTYLGLYLANLKCQTIVVENHYVDRDFILDLSVLYARNLRNYPNFCSRLHYFSCPLTESEWVSLFGNGAANPSSEVLTRLQQNYLGFTVVKPLAGSPVGRTVLATYPLVSDAAGSRSFAGTRTYQVHLAGHQFSITGLAFQQQDQGVSACATTALWSSLHKVAHEERTTLPSPSHITEAASRYLLADGRSLPSDGLNIQQICEAIRAAGLQPVVVKSVSFDEDRAQLAAYIQSGFPPVLAIQSVSTLSWHAICAVGLKSIDLAGAIPPPEHPHHLNAGVGVKALYVHDDRLGPYALADLSQHTVKEGSTTRLVTALQIQWPDKMQTDTSLLKAIIVPVPDKIRLTIGRVLAIGAVIAESAGMYFKQFSGRVILNARYTPSTDYLTEAFGFGLSPDGLKHLCCEAVLPRYAGVIQISVKEGPLLDVLMDTTETRANPSTICFIKRSAFPAADIGILPLLASQFGAEAII